MNVYIDGDFKCHSENADGRTAVEVEAFDDKCNGYIEGCRFVPAGQTWAREDGLVFAGEMLTPWMSSEVLDAAQREYEQRQLADMRAALAELGVV